jgi:hypothetical protein
MATAVAEIRLISSPLSRTCVGTVTEPAASEATANGLVHIFPALSTVHPARTGEIAL